MNKKALNTLLAGAVAVSALGAGASQAMEAKAKEGQEKCYGVVKAGMNNCGAADKSHGCATMAKEDGSGVEWIYLPTGTCEKLVGGSLTPIMDSEEEVKEATEEAKSHDNDENESHEEEKEKNEEEHGDHDHEQEEKDD